MQNIFIGSQEMFGQVPTYNTEVETFGRKWCQKITLKYKKMFWHHVHELSYTH